MNGIPLPTCNVSTADSAPVLGCCVLLLRQRELLSRWLYETTQAEPAEPHLNVLRDLLAILCGHLRRRSWWEGTLIGRPAEQVHGIGDARHAMRGMLGRFPWLDDDAEYSVAALAELPALVDHETWREVADAVEQLARIQVMRAKEN